MTPGFKTREKEQEEKQEKRDMRGFLCFVDRLHGRTSGLRTNARCGKFPPYDLKPNRILVKRCRQTFAWLWEKLFKAASFVAILDLIQSIFVFFLSWCHGDAIETKFISQNFLLLKNRVTDLLGWNRWKHNRREGNLHRVLLYQLARRWFQIEGCSRKNPN